MLNVNPKNAVEFYYDLKSAPHDDSNCIYWVKDQDRDVLQHASTVLMIPQPPVPVVPFYEHISFFRTPGAGPVDGVLSCGLVFPQT